MNIYEQAQAALEELGHKRTSWEQKREHLVSARADVQQKSGAAALEGTPTGKLADQLGRITQEIGIAGQALAMLDERITAAKGDAQLARIADTRAQVVVELEKMAAYEAKVKPLLDELENLTDLRYYHHRAYGPQEANRLLRGADWLEGNLPADVRRQLEAQRETTPTDVDRAIDRWQYPQAVEEGAA